jgi:hypothetical protein
MDIDFLYEEYAEDGSVTHKTHTIRMTMIFRYEMEYLLEKNGFDILEIFGDYERKPFAADSPQIITISKKRNNRNGG